MKDTAAPDGGPNPVDTHVGQRIRDRRKSLGMSQEKLATQLGLTFQQVQKYERGANRVSASKLYEIARALNASVAYFFEHLADTAGSQPGMAEAGATFEHEAPLTPEGRELASTFGRISRPKVRKRFLELAKALAEEEAG